MPDHELALLNELTSVGVPPRPTASLNPDPTSEVESVGDKAEKHTEEAAAPAATVTASNIWRHPDAHPIALDLALIRHYGPDWLGWEAETLRAQIPVDFHTSAVSDLNISKLQACKALHLVDSFWQRWEVFIACLMPLNNEFPDFRVMSAPTLAQCLVAVDIAGRIRDDVEWTSEMRTYFSVVYQHDGIFLPIPPLDFVELEVPEEVDQRILAQRWATARGEKRPPEGHDVLSEQVHRLFVVNEYLEESRTRLQQQLRLHV